MSNSPYSDLPRERFWRTGVTEQHPLTIENLYTKRFDISRTDRIATAGSCFAQHIARNLKQRGCHVLDVEPAPPGLSVAHGLERGYGMYSARYGNIYTARQLLQLVQEAFGTETPADRVWEKDGRFYDAQRPNVEPGGLDSAEQVLEHRRQHLEHVRKLFSGMDLFIFTFGLTEAWVHRESGTVFPTAPGTIAGAFDPAVYEFKNYTVAETLRDFQQVRKILKQANRGLKFLVTVSPVPLTATASAVHVLQATTLSKSILRAVCGELYERHDDIDYFPSYELIASPFGRGFFFEPNLRSVAAGGVASVMRIFFEQHAALQQVSHDPVDARSERRNRGRDRAARREGSKAPGKRNAASTEGQGPADPGGDGEDVVCEEAMLEAFAR